MNSTRLHVNFSNFSKSEEKRLGSDKCWFEISVCTGAVVPILNWKFRVSSQNFRNCSVPYLGRCNYISPRSLKMAVCMGKNR